MSSSSPSSKTPLHGVVMVAHGARAVGWDAPFQALQGMLQSEGAVTALGFLEHQTPTVADAVQSLVERGCVRITLAPMLLGVGMHAREDLPRHLAEATSRHPRVAFTLSQALGENPHVMLALSEFVKGLG